MNFIKTIRSQRKSELGILTAQEKRKFYLEELFEDHKYIKKYLIVIMLLFIASQLSSILSYSRGFTPLELSLKWIAFSTVIMSAIMFSLSFFIRLQQGSSYSIIIQKILLLLANLLTSCSILCRVYLFIHQAVQSPDLEAVTEGVSISVASIFAVKLTDLINPFWYFKIIIPIAYFIAWIICSYQIKAQATYQIWISCIIGIFNIIIVYAVSASFRWNLFVKRIDNETWTAIHKIILNKVLSPILVLSIKGEITYANPEFNNLSQGDLEAFTHKLQGLRRRKVYKNNQEEEEEEEHEREEGNPSYLNVEDIKNKGTLTKLPSDSTRKLSFLTQCNTYGEIQDLSVLLQTAQELLKRGEVHDNSYFIFDGKLINEQKSDSDSENQSFEVTLSFMVEYQKIILILRNTTDHAQLVTLENNNQYKDKLLASVSHELRTPLNGNLSLIEATINHPEVPASLKEQFLVPAHRSGKLLLHLINDILDYSQIGAKKLRLNFECLSIVDTIKSCHQLLDLQAKKKGIDLKLFIGENLSLFTTDHDRVRQIILNLLSNALKFTFSGSISLFGKLISPSHLKITVKDTGIGIKSDDLKQLFKEFTRIEGAHQFNLNTKGVGLGLTIANKLAKRLGPSTNQPGIKVKSVYGEGSSFSFIIADKKFERTPSRQKTEVSISGARYIARTNSDSQTKTPLKNQNLQQNDISEGNSPVNFSKYTRETFTNLLPVEVGISLRSTSNDNKSPVVKEETKNCKKVLIVDDEPFNILAVESFLHSFPVKIESAFNGKEAIDKITLQHDRNYDLILMDCQMPVLDGFEATKILKDMMNKNELTEIPIIGCTAFNGNEAVNLCYKVGMAHVLEKPLSKAKIDFILEKFLDYHSLL